MAEVENLKEIQDKKWGGKRTGAGRPNHSKNPNTIAREEAAKQFKQRVARNVDRLFNAQIDLALGEKYLMVITTIGEGAKQRRETTIVTDPEKIKEFLDSEEDPKFGEENEYYFMTTKAANNMALDSLLNRSFGKAAEKMDLDVTSKGEKIEGNTQLADDFAAYLLKKTEDEA